MRSFCTAALLLLATAASAQMYVESYWESWVLKDYPDDYCALLSDVPATPVGSLTGANYIDIAFGDYSGGFGGTECDESVIIDGINTIHSKGAKAKLAFGGALYSMSSYINSQADADNFAQSIVYLRDTYGLDGVDLDIEDSASNAETIVMVFQTLRNFLGDDFHISYTFPCLAEQFDPTMTAIANGHPYLDALNVMAYDAYWDGYSFELDLDLLEAMGVSRSKIVYGLMPGHSDAPDEYTSVDDVVNATYWAKQWGLAGVMTWDINRDTDQAKGYPVGEDNAYQTGLPDATYLNAISEELNG